MRGAKAKLRLLLSEVNGKLIQIQTHDDSFGRTEYIYMPLSTNKNLGKFP